MRPERDRTPRQTELAHLADDAVLERPIVIVGSPRSGTTGLSMILGTHPDLVLIGEPRMTWTWGNERKSDALRPSDARPEVRSHIRNAFARRAREAGASRIVEKTPSNSLRMGFVDRVLPGCLFLHIMRDPRDAVLSILEFWGNFSERLPRRAILQRLEELHWRQLPAYAREAARRALPGALGRSFGTRAWGPRLPGIGGLLRELDLVEVCALQWRCCVEAACRYGRRLPPERYFELRVEEFTAEKLAQILAFADLRNTPEVESEHRRRQEKKADSSRWEQADPELVQRIVEWTEPTARWLGYL